MILREAIEKDWKKIQELNYKLFVYENSYDKSLNMDWSFSDVGIQYYKDASEGKNNYKSFVVEDNDKIIGYILLAFKKCDDYRTVGNLIEVENVYVEEQYRKKGVGRMLFDATEKYAKEKGCSKIKLLANHQNDDGLNFYQKIGFDKYCIEMEKDIK